MKIAVMPGYGVGKEVVPEGLEGGMIIVRENTEAVRGECSMQSRRGDRSHEGFSNQSVILQRFLPDAMLE